MRISLIQTSQNRRSELHRFIKSLNAQIGIDFKQVQLIFVDQENNLKVFDEIDKRIEFQYIKYKHCSLSHARNIGLKYVKGDYVGFPDDDCWYEPDTLAKVFNMLTIGYAGVIAKGTDKNGMPTNDFPRDRKRLTKYNHCGAISYTIFVKHIKSIFFDENIGVGSPYKLSSGEETDYLINVISEVSENIWYIPNIIIHHPIGKIGNFENSNAKQYQYARGWGYLLRKHHYPIPLLFRSFIRPIGGILLSAILFNKNGISHSYYILKGRVEGYLYKIGNKN